MTQSDLKSVITQVWKLNFCSDAMCAQRSRAQAAGREVVGQMAEEKGYVMESRRKYRKRNRIIDNPKIWRLKKGRKLMEGKQENLWRERKKKQKEAGGRRGDEAGEELSWPQRATMPFRDLRTAEMACIEQTVSAAAPGSPQ